jgi:hypothetical protein
VEKQTETIAEGESQSHQLAYTSTYQQFTHIDSLYQRNASVGIERICVNDTVLYDGTKVSKDTLVMACHLVNHLDPQMHDDPTVFNPDRWLTPSRTVDSVRDYPGSYIPFSIG